MKVMKNMKLKTKRYPYIFPSWPFMIFAGTGNLRMGIQHPGDHGTAGPDIKVM
jgi:hypothetical protein